MKIAITAATAGALGMMDGRFGRAPYFLVFDTRQNAWEAHENKQNAELEHGAGIQASQAIEQLGAKVLITGQVGPKALQVLRANAVKVYCVEPGKVNEILTAFLEGHYSEFFAPNEKRGSEQNAAGTKGTGDSGISQGSEKSLHGDERQGRRGQEHHGCQRRHGTC